MRSVGTTGHRDVEQEPGELLQFARLFVVPRMIESGFTEIITGMARGWDLDVTQAAHEAGMQFYAMLPFPGQENGWPAEDQARYRALLPAARHVRYQSKLPLSRAYIFRDRLIVDASEELWALDSGRPSGSHTTVLYAEEGGGKVIPLWGDWLQFRSEKRHAEFPAPR